MWNKVASVVGIVAAIGAVWTRFVLLEARVDYSEEVVVALTAEIKELSKGLQRIEIDLAKKNYCVAQ
jgi:hypothetical protein